MISTQVKRRLEEIEERTGMDERDETLMIEVAFIAVDGTETSRLTVKVPRGKESDQ
jgi:hypothetical protein